MIQPSSKRLRLLVIDDEEVVREMVAEILKHSGFDVVVAADGEEGLAAVEQGGSQIDVVILDLSMPGLSGPDTFTRLSEMRPELPVILSSGYDHAEAMRRFQGQAPAGFIQKPYRPDQLKAEIVRCVERGGWQAPTH